MDSLVHRRDPGRVVNVLILGSEGDEGHEVVASVSMWEKFFRWQGCVVRVLCSTVGLELETAHTAIMDLFQQSAGDLVLIFAGHGENLSGDWTFADGKMTLDSLSSLWDCWRNRSADPHRKFVLISDCCESHAWLEGVSKKRPDWIYQAAARCESWGAEFAGFFVLSQVACAGEGHQHETGCSITLSGDGRHDSLQLPAFYRRGGRTVELCSGLVIRLQGRSPLALSLPDFFKYSGTPPDKTPSGQAFPSTVPGVSEYPSFFPRTWGI